MKKNILMLVVYALIFIPCFSYGIMWINELTSLCKNESVYIVMYFRDIFSMWICFAIALWSAIMFTNELMELIKRKKQ